MEAISLHDYLPNSHSGSSSLDQPPPRGGPLLSVEDQNDLLRASTSSSSSYSSLLSASTSKRPLSPLAAHGKRPRTEVISPSTLQLAPTPVRRVSSLSPPSSRNVRSESRMDVRSESTIISLLNGILTKTAAIKDDQRTSHSEIAQVFRRLNGLESGIEATAQRVVDQRLGSIERSLQRAIDDKLSTLEVALARNLETSLERALGTMIERTIMNKLGTVEAAFVSAVEKQLGAVVQNLDGINGALRTVNDDASEVRIEATERHLQSLVERSESVMDRIGDRIDAVHGFLVPLTALHANTNGAKSSHNLPPDPPLCEQMSGLGEGDGQEHEQQHDSGAAVGADPDDEPADEEDVGEELLSEDEAEEEEVSADMAQEEEVDARGRGRRDVSSQSAEDVRLDTPRLESPDDERATSPKTPALGTRTSSRVRSEVKYRGHPLDRIWRYPSQTPKLVKTPKRQQLRQRAPITKYSLRMGKGVPRTEAKWPQKKANTKRGRLCKGSSHWMCAGFDNDDVPDDWHCPDCRLRLKNGATSRTIPIADQYTCIRHTCVLREKQAIVIEEGDEDHFAVEAIVGRRLAGDGLQYLVKWVGWDYLSCTWQSESGVENLQDRIDDFITEAIEDGPLGRTPRILPVARKWFSETDGELRARYRAESEEE